ncbi:MAG: glutathione S-transferase family protein [Solirubrobacteraceae bacterium]|nr:glutathione S-transferase family protein [Solirubrobacteraceae bacterium]
MLVAVADRLKLYVVPGSHPCATVERALELKGLAYERVDLLPVVHALHQQLRFGKRTVPGLVLEDGSKVVGSRAILRVLDGLVPDPPLLPADEALRAKVEAAEAWGDATLQPLARRVIWAAFARDHAALPGYAAEARLPLPLSVAARSAPVVVGVERALNHADDETVRADLAALPAHLDRVDGWIADGVLGGERPNAADLQVGAGLRLLTTIGDVAPLVDARPAGRLARRLFPRYPGAIPAGALPAEWLPGAEVGLA